MAPHFLFLVLFALAISHAFGSDPSQLQDFCVADPMSQGITIQYLSVSIDSILFS
jgi:hypothetical protein